MAKLSYRDFETGVTLSNPRETHKYLKSYLLYLVDGGVPPFLFDCDIIIGFVI